MIALIHLLATVTIQAQEPAEFIPLCDDNFEQQIAALGSTAGLVMFVATEYTLSQRQMEVAASFSRQWPSDELKFFTVEVNRCPKVVIGQRIARVPAAVLYQDGAKRGEFSSLSQPISSEQLTELVEQRR